jgi:di/tricarboxylate transporter
MNTDLAIVLVLLTAAIAMFAINKPRMDAVALIRLTVLPFTGVISMGEALAIFIPVALRIARRSTGASPSRLRMPLSVAALKSGVSRSGE